MKTLILQMPVIHWPRAISPHSRTAPKGTEVILVRRESATLFTVRLADAGTDADTFPVLASEVAEAELESV